MYPLKFEPILKQTLWGGDKIIPFKHLNSDLKGVGESWEISGVEKRRMKIHLRNHLLSLHPKKMK